MRNYIIWTLSILLGFEPALWAQGAAQQQAQIKAFIEKTEIAKRPVSIRELYEKNASVLSAAEKQTLKNFITAYGDQKLPKMDVTKVNGQGGVENYSLQFVQDGHSVNLEIINQGDVFARMNGKILTMKDMQSIESLMIKMGVSVADAHRNFGRKPANQPSRFLNADQVKQLSGPDKIQYFKQLRQLLESMEAVENANMKQKTSSLDSFNKFEVIAGLLQGSSALAMSKGDSCVAAGWIAKVTADKSGHLRCGGDIDGNVAEEYRALRNPEGEPCGKDKFGCNSAVYPVPQCFPGSINTTAQCNGSVKDRDIPDLNKDNQAAFNQLAAEAKAEAEKVMAICSGISGGSSAGSDSSSDSGESAAPKKNKGSKKAASAAKSGSKSSSTSGLDEDQRVTCENFKKRYNEINSWKCKSDDGKPTGFAEKYKNLCAAEKPAPAEQTPPAATNPPATPAAPAKPAGRPNCSELPDNQAPAGSECNGSVSNLTGPNEVIFCNGGNGPPIQIVTCDCSPGKLIGKFRCSKGSGSGGDEGGSSSGRTKEKKEKPGTNWWLIGGVSFVALALFHYLNKKAVNESYKTLDPIPQQPPVPPPTVPVPRGVL